jgi:PleD family two-component response regulator
LKRYKILACTSPQAERRLRKALPSDDVQMALTFSEATSALRDQNWDLVIVGSMFHESRALELMELLSSQKALARMPVVGIRGAKIPRLTSAESFDVPMKALGAVDVIDFASIPDDDAGNAQLGERIRAASA